MSALPFGPAVDPRRSWGAWLVGRLAVLALLWPLFFLLANPLRLAFVAETFVPFAAFNLLLTTLIGCVAIAWIDRMRLGGLDVALLGGLALAGLGTDWRGPELRDLVVDVVKPAAFVLTVVAIRELVDPQSLLADRARPLRRAAAWIGTVTVAVVIACHLVSALVLPLYPAYASVDSLLALAWTAATGAGWATLGYFVVLLASGKRGVYLAALVVLWVTRRHWLHRAHAVALVAAGVAATVLVLGVLGPEWVANFVLKINDPTGDVALQASGYRLAEIGGALATMGHPVDWLVGKGFGFSFAAPGFVGNEGEDEAHRNLHLTPMSILVYYGLAFFVPFYLMLGSAVVRALRLIRDGGAPAAVGAFYLGSLAFSFTEFSVFVYASFAVSCGLVFAFDRMRAGALPAVRAAGAGR